MNLKIPNFEVMELPSHCDDRICVLMDSADHSEASDDSFSLATSQSPRAAGDTSCPLGDTPIRICDDRDSGSWPPPRTKELRLASNKRTETRNLIFTDISYSVPVGKSLPAVLSRCNVLSSQNLKSDSTKPVLTSVSGVAHAGEVTAIMGASGSGKTTLLDVLAHRIAPSRRSGSVCLGTTPVNAEMMRKSSGYVLQDDLMFSALTVYETLMFAARLRLPSSMSLADKQAKVQSLLALLGLEKAAQTFIGDENRRGVSGGERKRVSIGVEMLGDPKLLFLDEPTSGLDSTSAYRVVAAVKNIAAHTGSVAVMVLHQVCKQADLTVIDAAHALHLFSMFSLNRRAER